MYSSSWGWFRWDFGISRYGFFFCSIYDLLDNTNPYSEPEGYDVSKIKRVNVEPVNTNQEYLPDIIFILNESFFDLEYYTDIAPDINYMSAFYDIPGGVYGHAVCSNIGGGTNNSEFEFLMSKSMFLMNSAAPFTYINESLMDRSIVTYLGKLGYTTTGAHCGAERNYNRDKAYPAMKFDRVLLGEESFNYIREYGNRSWLDSDNYKDMIDHYEANKNGPQFMFLLTFQNHGGYEQNEASLDTVHTGKDFGSLTDDVDEYLSSIKLSAEAFRELTDYYSECDRDVIICMVGDHAPSFITSLPGREGQIAEMESIIQRSVPYVIWSNFDADFEMYTEYASMVDLVPMVLKASGMPLSPFYQNILVLHEVLPVRTSEGLYMDKSMQLGRYNSESEYYDLLNQYYYMEYNSLLEDEEYQKQLFTTPLAD